MYNNILYQPLRLNHNILVSIQVKQLINGVRIFIILNFFISSNKQSCVWQLLQKEQSVRLGANESDFNEIRDHPFFHDLNWNQLLEKKLPVPWLPELESETDTRHIDPEFTSENISASVGASLISNSLINNGQNSSMNFVGFTYEPESNFN